MMFHYVTSVVVFVIVFIAVVTCTPSASRRNNKQRHSSTTTVDGTLEDVTSNFKNYGDTPMGCKELRSKRYISDGPCTSIKPITEVVCAGICLPVSKLPWYSDYVNLWYSRRQQSSSSSHSSGSISSADGDIGNLEEPWQCVDDVVKRKRVHLMCQDGQHRAYVIKTVRSCKCKKRKKSSSANNDINKS
ncbi:Sclerostin domain-containing protein 1 [Chamberlinius hualienensis]